MKRLFVPALITLMLCLPLSVQAKVEHLLPKVHSLAETKGTPFALQRAVTITYDGFDECALLESTFKGYGCTIGQSGATVTVQKVDEISDAYDYTLEGYDNEGYQLTVTENAITIKAVKPIGVIRAAQTLAQLAEGYEEGQAAIEAVEITDWAAFKLRGYMHDVGRSFISVEELKKHIDLLSRFKVNTFHWHFTENQAWRFEVIDNDPNNDPDYTKLTSTESMTRFEGKYYTQAECREVAQYAHERGVTIIPEIDMPGHSAAFKRAMGYSMQTPEGVEVLKEVLTQLVDVFPHSPYIHIGADEEKIEYVDANGKGFLEIMASHIRETLGRKMVVWNPISGVSINSTMCDMTQMWSSSGKNIDGVPDIDCRYNYTNHFDVFADVVGIYKSNIYYADKGSEEIAGTISAYWNDRKTPTEEDIVKQNNMYANVLASAERAWIGSKVNGAEGYIEKLGTTLPNSGEVYEEFKDWEERFLFHKTHSLKDEPIPYVKQTNVRWRITDPFPNGGNLASTFAPDQYATSTDDEGLIPETFTHEGKTYYTGMATGAGIYLRHTWGNNIIPTYYGSTNHNNSTAYAWTYVYSETEQEVGAQIEFQNYGRSEKDGVPSNGKWDHYGSQIWINGVEVSAPSYKNAGKSINNEVDLLDENFTARKPIAVTLNAGWNKVFIKLPYKAANYRLPKWMFTCVFTTLDGVDAVEGLIYSPNQCKDEATELVAAKVSEIKRDRGNLIGTAVGLWPESAAETLDAKVKEIEATYAEEKSAEQRAAQVTELEEAWTAFVTSLTDANMNLPVSGNYYRMYTPQRGNRYATGNGADAAITGPTEATTKASIWQFVSRNDDSYDIINLADGTYISPESFITSGNNKSIKTVTAQPNAGWTIKKAETTGNVIVVSGTAQFNQQKDGNLHLLNWGSGTNTTDDGCEYRFVDVSTSVPPQPLVKLEGLGSQTYPYAIDDALAAKVFAKENITIALDIVTASSMSSRGAIVCASDPTQAAATSAIGTATSPYIALGQHSDRRISYLRSALSGDQYSGTSLDAATSYKLIYVINGTQSIQAFKCVDGTVTSLLNRGTTNNESINWLQNLKQVADNYNGAKLYIGGGVTKEGNKDVFSGQIRSVQFFDGALNAEKIAMIEYPVNEEDIILSEAAVANSNMDIYGLQCYLGLVQDAGTGIEGNGQFICNYPAATSQESGNAYANLIDGNYDTFFHSGYNNTIGSGSHYLQADLGKAVKSFRFYFKKRSQNNNNRPTKITIEGSNDKESWSEVKVISSGFPTDAAVLDYFSEEITSTTAYQHYRFTVNSTSNSTVFFTFSEFYIFPSEYTRVKETFDAVRAYRAGATVETATALNAVYAWNKGLNEGSPIVGVESYIYADTYKDGAFLNRYLYNNNGTLTLTTELSGADSFVWTPAVTEDGKYNFKNKVSKYLAHKGMSDNAHNFTVAATTHHMGVTLHTQGDNYWVIKNADGGFDQSSVTYDQKTTNYCTDFVFIPTNLYEQTFEPVVLKSADEFENGGIYTFVTKRGWMGATASSNNVISTVRTNVDPAASATNAYFQWAVYKSAKGNYYLYNVGKGKYMGVQSSNNTSVPFVDAPNNKLLTFKQSSNADYPIMFSTDNKSVVNHSGNHGEGLITWTGGWDNLTDEGSNHQVTLVGSLSPAVLKSIADLVDESEADQVQLYIKAEVEGLEESNSNTHFGTVRATSKFGGNSIKLKRTSGVATIEYLETPTTVIDFTRAYRGFEFQGFFLGEENLGTSFTPEEGMQTSEDAPLIAKFTATDEVTLFYDDDEFSYRIPAIATTSTGRLIAVSDYRHNLDDIGRDKHGTGTKRIDLVIRTSDDNGKTWSEKMTIAAGDDTKAGSYLRAFGDAAIAAVGQNIIVMAAAGDVLYPSATDANPNRMARIFSSDNGKTWSKEEITTKMYNSETSLVPQGVAAFFGSGKLVVDADFNGTGKSRIYGALLVRTCIEGTYNNYNNYVVYSDDLGENWAILGGSTDPIASGDEPKVEILPNGQILLSARRGGGRVFNVFTYTDKGSNSGTWSGTANGCDNGGSNGTNGEIFCVDAKKPDGTAVKLLLQSQPKGGSGQYDRKDVTIWYKEIDANTSYTATDIAANWTEGLQVSNQKSSYSAVTLQQDGKIGIFFEEAPCYADNYEKGYCMVYVPLTIEEITKNNYITPEIKDDEEEGEVTSADALPGDGTLRFYRLAIPVTLSAFENDLNGDYGFLDEDYQSKVIPFWQECEDFVNEVFIPLGMCFDVVMDKRLVMKEHINDLDKSEELPGIGNCTNLINDVIGADSYDVGMWVTHRKTYAENSGLSVEGGVYNTTTKGSGYAKTDKWVVAHEIGHLFGAPHTTTGEGSLMDSGGDDFFAYPSIKIIRDRAKGTASYDNVKVPNNAPQFDTDAMQRTYRIPQGACLSIDVQATDAEDHRLLYTAIGCSSANVGNIIEGGTMPHFASFVPQESNVINYQPIYAADVVYDDYFYLKEGTGVHEMEPGSYPLSILVNDVPSTAWSYAALTAAPFYSTYAIWETQVEIVEGEAFTAAIESAETAYTAGEEITVKWGVNANYFTSDSKVRISLSTDYGKTFKYVLAESVEALAGECTVTLPNVNIGQVDVDFTTAVRKMNGGVIKVEEIGGAVYTLTALDPNNDKGFTVTGGVDESDGIITTIGKYEIGTFYANDAMVVPEGVTAYVATAEPQMEGTDAQENATGVITMTKVEDGIIPAQTGALIRGKQGTYAFKLADTDGETDVTNSLMPGYAGIYEHVNVELESGYNTYVLTVMDGVVGFYRKEAGFNVYNNKAYLKIPATVPANALRIRFADEETTDIEFSTLNTQPSTQVYDLMGRRVTTMLKGNMYIVNGKKVVIK